MSVTSDILKLKKEKNAVILAHYYVDEDVQEVADYVGDSFYLSKIATKVDQDIIVSWKIRCKAGAREKCDS